MTHHPEQHQDIDSCLNCGQALGGRYCGNCGQEVQNLRRPFFRLSAQLVQSLFELDGRAYRTLFYLLCKPAYLSREYFDGRRMRYTPPLRLFLVISVSFFLLISLYTSIQSFEGTLNSEPNLAAPATEQVPLEAGEATISENLAAILAFVDQVSLPFFAPETNENLRAMMRGQAESNFAVLTSNPGEFARGYLEYITFFMLLMMPLMALILKIFYFRTGHYYTEHLVLTLHNHSFILMVLFVTSLTDRVAASQIPFLSTVFDYLGDAIYLWMVVYLYLSLKNYFQQGYGLTLLKFLATSTLYGFTLGAGILIFSGVLFFLF